MKIYAILDNNQQALNGCFYVRIHNPLMELKKRGHDVEYMTLTGIEWEELKKADIVVFSRVYSSPHLGLLWRCKANGIKVVYDLDDDIWHIPKTNVAHVAYESGLKNKAEDILREADMVTTTTETLKKELLKFNDNVKVLPNALNLDKWEERPNREGLKIGWSGGQNHLEDLLIVADAIAELQEKYDFTFVVQGMTSKPLEADGYESSLLKSIGMDNPVYETVNDIKLDLYKKLLGLKKFYHIPFYPPDMHPKVLSSADIDIGIIPIIGYRFDESKSVLKLLEYTAVGTPAICSNELPYKEIASYTVENRKNKWYTAIEKMIKDKQFREDILKKQKDILFPKYSLNKVGSEYEDKYKQLIK